MYLSCSIPVKETVSLVNQTATYKRVLMHLPVNEVIFQLMITSEPSITHNGDKLISCYSLWWFVSSPVIVICQAVYYRKINWRGIPCSSTFILQEKNY